MPSPVLPGGAGRHLLAPTLHMRIQPGHALRIPRETAAREHDPAAGRDTPTSIFRLDHRPLHGPVLHDQLADRTLRPDRDAEIESGFRESGSQRVTAGQANAPPVSRQLGHVRREPFRDVKRGLH